MRAEVGALAGGDFALQQINSAAADLQRYQIYRSYKAKRRYGDLANRSAASLNLSYDITQSNIGRRSMSHVVYLAFVGCLCQRCAD